MRNRRAFSLVELLVVIGIIVLLLSILLPTLSRLREQARQVACMSNLRQLGAAMVLYTQDNEDRYPFHADGNGEHAEDWIWWQANRVANFPRGGVARYMGARDARVETYRCPSDDLNNRPRVIWEPYRFSYTLNFLFAGNGLYPTLNRNSVHDPSRKIVMADEDEASLDDGNFHPLLVGQVYENFLSIRHDHRARKNGAGSDDDRRGNAAFADGHAEYISRRNSRDPSYYDPKQ